MSRLLELPSELLTNILSYLPLENLVFARTWARQVDGLINESTVLQYQIALQSAALVDNPESPLSASDRLEALRKREAAWQSLLPCFYREYPLPFAYFNHGEQVAASGVLGHLAVEPGGKLGALWFSQSLPTAEDESGMRWKKMRLDHYATRFKFAVEDDLLVTISKDPNRGPAQSPTVRFIRFSTGDAHPEAEIPVIRTAESFGSPPFGPTVVEICGRYVGVLVNNVFIQKSPGFLRVYVWRTGKVVLSIPTTHKTHHGFLFLSEDVLLLPVTTPDKIGVLNFYRIPKNPEQLDTVPLPIQVLTLPILHFPIDWVICGSGRPSCSLHRSTPSKRPFRNTVERDFLIHIALGNYQCRDSFVVHHAHLLSLLPNDDPTSSVVPLGTSERPLPWLDWGLPIVGWLPSKISFKLDLAFCGQRVVYSKRTRMAASLIHVRDYNPYRVNQALSLASALPNGIAMKVCLKEPAVSKTKDVEFSHLPYIEYTMTSEQKFDEIWIDEERVFGLMKQVRSGTEEKSKLAVFYFG